MIVACPFLKYKVNDDDGEGKASPQILISAESEMMGKRH